MITRPMLAETIHDVNSLKLPVFASPKLDGIRCLIVGGKALTRKFKPIPNTFVREWLEANCKDGMDGELMVPGVSFNGVQSAIMSEAGEPNFEYHVFDYVSVDLAQGFDDRLWALSKLLPLPARIVPVIQTICETVEHLLDFEKECLEKGYEGVMTRTENSPYKCGRSSLKQGWLLKLKRFSDSEAVVLDMEELMSNQNEVTVNELGLSKRSSHKDNLIPAGMLGQFLVKDLYSGQVFYVGTGEGLTKELRRSIWAEKDKYLNTIIKYKYQPSGAKDLPRFPVWLGFRDERDL